MKRLTPMLPALALVFSLLCACGGPGAEASPSAAPSDPPVSNGPLGDAEPTQEPSLALPTDPPSAEPSAEPSQEPSAEPSQEPSAEPSAGPVENPPASPSQPAAEPSLSRPPEPEAAPSDELCSLPPAPSDPAAEDSQQPAPPAAAEVDLQNFYDELVFDDPDFNASAELYNEYLDVQYPGLTAIPTNQLLVYQPMMSAVVCEIALVEVQDSADIKAVVDILQARIAAQVGTEDEPGGAWYPASIAGWQNNSRIVSHGRYIMMIAYDKCDDVVAAFDALFSDGQS